MSAHHVRLRPFLASAALVAALAVLSHRLPAEDEAPAQPVPEPAPVQDATSPTPAPPAPTTAGEKVLTLPSSSTNTSVALAAYAAGLKAERAGNLSEAMRHFQAAVDADPSLTDVATRLAAAYLKQGDYPAALKLLHSLARQKPGDLRLKESIAFVTALSGQPPAARAAARVILGSHSHNLAAQATFYELDRAYLGDAGAVLALQRRSGRPADDPAWWIRLGEAYARLLTDHSPLDATGVGTRALPFFEQALQRNPTNVALLARVADLRSIAGQYAAAATAYQTLATTLPDRPELRLRHALALASLQDITNAIPALREAVKVNPSLAAQNLPILAELHYLNHDRSAAGQALRDAVAAGSPPVPTANLALRRNDLATARDLLTRALEANPEDNAAALRLADVLTLQKDATAALDLMRRLIERNPASLDLKAAAAGVAREVGRPDESLAFLDTCDQIAGPNALPAIRAELAFQRGATLERMGRFAEAEASLRLALSLTPDSPKLLNYLGFSLADRSLKLDEARAMIEKAVAAEPNNAAYLDSLGWVKFRQGQLDEALRHILDSIALEPDESEILEHLGEIHLALGQERLALDAFERAVTADPKRESARKLRDAVAARYEPQP